MAYKPLPYPALATLCRRIFESYRFSEEESRIITDVLLTADLYGIESHGVQRLVRYYNELGWGMIDVHAVPKTLFETPISARIDAKKAMGQLMGYRAMQTAIDKAKTSGIGMVTVCNSNHFGIAGYYTRMAADADLLGVCMTNTEAIMVPTFGRRAMIGTDPIALSMPADPTPFLFDAATTVVPRGKLEVYNKRESPLPPGWAVDETGADCTDAKTVIQNIVGKVGGGILPLGGSGELNSGYKGYGFGLICELFTGILAGGVTANHISSVGDAANISHCFWAVDYGIFGDKAEIRRNFSRYLDELRHTPTAKDAQRVYIHGEKELESMERKHREGIPVNEKTFAEIVRIARERGVDPAGLIGTEF